MFEMVWRKEYQYKAAVAVAAAIGNTRAVATKTIHTLV